MKAPLRRWYILIRKRRLFFNELGMNRNKENMVWIPIRTVYHKELKVADFLKKENLEVFIPMKYELREKETADGECERILVPAIHNLLFVKQEYNYDWCMDLVRRMPVPIFFFKKWRSGKDFCIISEKEMKNFMDATNPDISGTRFIDPEVLKNKKSVPVRVIKEGPLFGLEGKFMRYGGKHYIAVELANSTALLKVSYTWCEVIDTVETE